MGIVLKPSEAVEGGGLLDDVDVRLTNPRFELYDYDGKVAIPVPTLSCDMILLENGQPVPDTELYVQHWSMGNAKDFVPSKDGKSLNPVGSRTAPNASSNGMIFINTLVQSGFPEDQIGDDISVFDGAEIHVQRQPAPKRKGMAPREDGREATVLVCTSILAMPGEAKKPAAKGKAAGKAAPAKSATKAAPAAAPAGDDDAISEKATNTLMEILMDNPEGITKNAIPGKLFTKLASDPDKSAVVKLAFSDDFLSAGPWSYEDGVLKMGA